MSSPTEPIRAAVLTVSDRCSRCEAVDTSGPGLCEMLRSQLGAVIVATRCLPDEPDALAACWLSRPGPGST
jgi:molybdopterin biosynthesis enzyme MoaB